MQRKHLKRIYLFLYAIVSEKSFKIFATRFMTISITFCLIMVFVICYIDWVRVRLPVRLGMGFFVDGYRYIDRNRFDAMWKAEKFYMNDDGSFEIILRANYSASEPSSVATSEYVGSGFFMIADAVYGADPFVVSRQRLSGLISVVAQSIDSRSCIIEYQGSYNFPADTFHLRYLEVQFSWVRVFRVDNLFYFQWVQGSMSDWKGETNRVYQNIEGGFLACYPIPEYETNSNLLSVDFPSFNYVEWLKANL